MGWGPTLHQNWGTNSATDGASVGVPLPHCSKFGECTSYWISWIFGIAVSIHLLQLGTTSDTPHIWHWDIDESANEKTHMRSKKHIAHKSE